MLTRAFVYALLAGVLLVGPPASAQPRSAEIETLPPASAWQQHLERDILPFWETPAALGTPVGNFPTVRCDDGALLDPQSPCPEYRTAPEWIRAGIGRQYVRMMSRQIYLYGVAFHLIGDPKYLIWARAGVRRIIEGAVDKNTHAIASYWEGGKALSAGQTSQDLSYALVGLSFYYYLTRDPEILWPILRVEAYIRRTYYDPRLGLYRWKLDGPDSGRVELVAQLNQANAYMLLLTPLLPPPEQQRWRGELAGIARTLRERFYHPASSMFLGALDPKTPAGTCIYKTEDTDFGHTIKSYWMLYLTGRALGDNALAAFARAKAPDILRRAYLPATGSWATQPTCDPAPGDIDKTSSWRMAAELDQAALTFGIADPQLLSYIPKTFDFWLQHMVDRRFGEVWDEVTLPDYAPRRPKVHLWKNGFHTAEHALVGYVASSAIRAEPAVLYYAFPGCKLPAMLRPYYYDAIVTAHTETPLPEVPGFCRVQVAFAKIH